jgi:alkaline phosphatase
MSKIYKLFFSILTVVFLILVFSCEQSPLSDTQYEPQYPKNIIIFIGDGLGFEQVKAASFFKTGSASALSFSDFPVAAEVMTASASSSITDSAAAATAMATGIKVENGVLSARVPGDGSEIQTLLESAGNVGKGIGLVTTAYLTHATPAAFGAHEASRSNYAEIAGDYLSDSRPDVMMGGGENGLSISAASAEGYSTATNAPELSAHPTDTLPFAGLFGTTNIPYEYDGTGLLPGLTEMVSKALEMLAGYQEGFFLMAEGGRIDHAAHANDLERMVYETIEFSDAVALAMDWAEEREDTLIVVTADHETGGLSVDSNNGTGVMPSVTWSTGGHTGVNVPLYAMGYGAGRFGGTIENTRIHDILRSLLEG